MGQTPATQGGKTGERLGDRLGKDWDAGGASHAMGEVRKKPNEIALRVGSKSADTN